MKLKRRVGDFRVRELLDPDYLVESGDYRVYRVTKRKLTTPEAVEVLAREAGVQPADVGIAGFKDRQGVTIQYMSVARGKPVQLHSPELKIDPAGFAREELTGDASRGNAFELNVRELSRADLKRLRTRLPESEGYGIELEFHEFSPAPHRHRDDRQRQYAAGKGRHGRLCCVRRSV